MECASPSNLPTGTTVLPTGTTVLPTGTTVDGSPPIPCVRVTRNTHWVFGREVTYSRAEYLSFQEAADHAPAYKETDPRGGFCRIVPVTTTKPEIALRISLYPLHGMRTMKREEKLLNEISHRNIAPLLCSVETRQFKTVQVHALYDGDILDFGTKYHYDLAMMCDWFLSICSGLEYLHNKNIIHEDLKPDNLLYKHTTNGLHIALTDFGYAGREGTSLRGCKSSNFAPELSEFWQRQDFQEAHPSGNVLFDTSCKRRPANDIWSLGYSISYMLCPYDRDQGKKELSAVKDFIQPYPGTAKHIIPAEH